MTPNVKRSRRNIKYQEVSTQKRRDCFGKIGKLAVRFIGPYQVIGRVGEVPYRLDLPADMNLHPMFYVSMLRKHIRDPSAIEPERVEGLQSNLTYQEGPIRLGDKRVQHSCIEQGGSVEKRTARRIRGEREHQGGSEEISGRGVCKGTT
ncbi:unnamed protein product [Microthlaspi erraticum]|uniref:Tf2-1-like SH3-like domain-containing protein n=1 Tax=Microthlaspi erraticum TaxID=1685480 RepID=A0A6D2LDE7_9BRAS|nr:unnamed protein product [Microthlaspi erraticum]